MTYENDMSARYLAIRILQHNKDSNTGVPYEKAITSPKTTKEAIDWWIEELK